jgi:hypothetical protein
MTGIHSKHERSRVGPDLRASLSTPKFYRVYYTRNAAIIAGVEAAIFSILIAAGRDDTWVVNSLYAAVVVKRWQA